MERRDMLKAAGVASAAWAAQQAKSAEGQIVDSYWAIVELMGRKVLAGRVSQGPMNLIRCDVIINGGFITKMIGVGSVYNITVVDENTAKAYAKKGEDPLPAIAISWQEQQRLGYDDGWD